jgi:hypothetical protein
MGVSDGRTGRGGIQKLMKNLRGKIILFIKKREDIRRNVMFTFL